MFFWTLTTRKQEIPSAGRGFQQVNDAVGGSVLHPQGWSRTEQLPPLLKCFNFPPDGTEIFFSLSAFAIAPAEAPKGLQD